MPTTLTLWPRLTSERPRTWVIVPMPPCRPGGYSPQTKQMFICLLEAQSLERACQKRRPHQEVVERLIHDCLTLEEAPEPRGLRSLTSEDRAVPGRVDVVHCFADVSNDGKPTVC